MAAGALTVGGVMVEQQQFVGSGERVTEAKKAISDYFTVNGRLPCPARMDLAPGVSGFGMEAACNNSSTVASGTWRTGGSSTNYSATDGVRIGALPVRTLGLRDATMADDYGNRIWYAMSETFGKAGDAANAVAAITIIDGNGNKIAEPTSNANSPGAAFVVFSAGPDGKGAFRYSTASMPVACSGGLDTENCNRDAVFRDTRFNNGSGSASFFDDMLTWVPKYLLTTTNGSVAAPPVTSVQFNQGGNLGGSANFVWDSINNRVGIGTSAPEAQLHVTTGARIRSLMIGANSSSEVMMTYPYESIGTALAVENFRLQTGGGIIFHTAMTASEPAADVSKVRMEIGKDGNIYLGNADNLGWGPALMFGRNSGGHNSDSIYFQRNNSADDESYLHLIIGDNSIGDDAFIIRTTTTNRFVFRNNGRQDIAADEPSSYALNVNNSGTHGIMGSASKHGIVGYARDADGHAVHGVNSATGAWGSLGHYYHGVYGVGTNGSNGYGLYGTSAAGSACGIGRADGYAMVCSGGRIWVGSEAEFRGNPSTSATTSLRVVSPNGGLLEDWPNTWGGGIATWDIVGSSTYFSGYLTRSDRRYKKDIAALDTDKMVDAVMKLKPVSYHYKDKLASPNLQYGFIAQDVREVMPNLVTGKETKTEKLGLNYDGFLAPIVATLQELKREQDRMKEQGPANTADAAASPLKGEDGTEWRKIAFLLLCANALQFVGWMVHGFRLRRIERRATA